MDLSDVAELQVLLEGVPLPAERDDLIAYAEREAATPIQLGRLKRLPEREYETIDEVAETLIRVQPAPEHEVPDRPREESGEPPGGEAYTDPHPESGTVRN